MGTARHLFSITAQQRGRQVAWATLRGLQARKPGAANRHAKKVGERLAEWVRGEVGIIDPNLQPNHGWRRASAIALGRAGLPRDSW